MSVGNSIHPMSRTLQVIPSTPRDPSPRNPPSSCCGRCSGHRAARPPRRPVPASPPESDTAITPPSRTWNGTCVPRSTRSMGSGPERRRNSTDLIGRTQPWRSPRCSPESRSPTSTPPADGSSDSWAVPPIASRCHRSPSGSSSAGGSRSRSTWRAGSSLVIVEVDDVDAHVAELMQRGVTLEAADTPSGMFRIATATDPDGNAITLSQDLHAAP